MSSVLANPDSYKVHTNLLDLGTDEKKNKIGLILVLDMICDVGS